MTPTVFFLKDYWQVLFLFLGHTLFEKKTFVPFSECKKTTNAGVFLRGQKHEHDIVGRQFSCWRLVANMNLAA